MPASNARQSWRRVLGLSSRALSLTGQRVLDVTTIYLHLLRSPVQWDCTVLVIGLLVTTLLMACTMQRQWSAKHNQPHGVKVGIITSVLQIAPIYEMLDKICYNSPRGFVASASEPLLPRTAAGTSPAKHDAYPAQSKPLKGSPGENAMRGVRKMSMVNLPQAFISLWYHLRQLIATDGDLLTPTAPSTLGFSFLFGFIVLSLGIADFVLYIWVDDAFVRENKKLVTLHYCVELMSRIPTLILFHVTFSRLHGYVPTIVLVSGDVLLSSLCLLVAPHFQSRNCCNWRGFFCRQTLTQFMYSLLVSFQLFFVNIVFFDPGMIFFYVNQVFYVIKYVELCVMWQLIGLTWRKRLKEEEEVWGHSVVELPHKIHMFIFFASMLFAIVNALIVCGWVPYRRREKDYRHSACAQVADPNQIEVVSDSSTPTQSQGMDSDSRILERLEEIFELLLTLSKVTCPRNRSMLLALIVDELWLQALDWEGVYVDESGSRLSLQIEQSPRHVVSVTREDLTVEPAPAYTGSIADGVLILCTGGEHGFRRGSYDGIRIRWDNGVTWVKERDPERSAFSTSCAVLRLILPQLAIALRWDVQAHTHDARGDTCGRPLLDFLIQYILITRRPDFLSDLYWNLVCLSQEESESKGGGTVAYQKARLTLLETLRGDFADGVDEDLAEFLRCARRQLQGQREVWQQEVELITKHSGRSMGGGSWNIRTERLQSALRQWPDIRQRAASTRTVDIDEKLLQSPRSASYRPRPSGNTSASSPIVSPRGGYIDLVAPVPHKGAILSMPIDPMTHFRGVVIEETEVLPSKQAPLMLVCKTKRAVPKDPTKIGLATDGTQQPGGRGDADDIELREKYLLKVGDDLRQDQLMLEMMALMDCVWKERLTASDAKLLQLANFRVLAITPTSGYVKFVPDAVALTEALHQSQGNLTAWLERNMAEGMTFDEVLDNFCGSVAACCVVTYVLGIGDRHLENLCITQRGQFFHIDFGFVLGDDPKPMAPQV